MPRLVNYTLPTYGREGGLTLIIEMLRFKWLDQVHFMVKCCLYGLLKMILVLILDQVRLSNVSFAT